MCESAFRHIGKWMFTSSNVCQDNLTAIPIDIKLNGTTVRDSRYSLKK